MSSLPQHACVPLSVCIHRARHRILYGLSPNDELYTSFTPLRPIKHRVGFQPGALTCPYARERERERERRIMP